MKSEDLNGGDLTAWERECAAAYEELVKAGICQPAKNGIWQFSDEYMRLDESEQARRLQHALKLRK